jgi:acyl carrier protein
VNNDDDRLMNCFLTVFPGATRDEIKGSKFEDISGWDSLRGVTLLAVLDDEFGLQMDMDELLVLGNFDALERQVGNAR